jgi:ABC-type ATPase involved in cell division/GNAT superfamily N-acetyltransferase
MLIDYKVSSDIDMTPRVKQLGAMFDVPLNDTIEQRWTGSVDLDAHPWSVGLIVGPSGCGKSTLAKQLFGEELSFAWSSKSVIDDFDDSLKMQDITKVCSAVGFNTIPSWMKPYHVLSTGEKFRVHLARVLLESGELAIIDEFTSVVDRQVAKIASHAVQRYVRRQVAEGSSQRFVAVGCHYDVIEWLQPDWVFEPTTMTLTWRSVQPRPRVNAELVHVTYEAWKQFAPYHYLTGSLNTSSKCFALMIDGRLASFAGMLWHPMSKRMQKKRRPIVRCSRLVTLPDWQGLGLAFVLIDAIGAAYRSIGMDVRTYPAHPSLIRSFDRSAKWSMKKPPGQWSTAANSSLVGFGNRPCAVFSYAGPAMENEEAWTFLKGATFGRVNPRRSS